MQRTSLRWIRLCVGVVAAGSLCLTWTLQAETPSDTKEPGQPADDVRRVTLETARDRARLLHDVYSITLEAMHDRFFERGKSVLPARALEDVFADMEEMSNGKAQWISVNTKAMTIDHEPKTPFEKVAARQLAAGKTEWESVEDGVYRRATPIPLSSSCVGCHTGFFSGQAKSARMAGLVISIPVADTPPASP